MNEVIHIKGIVGVRILEGLGKRREREIYTVLAEPDGDGFFIEIKDDKLACKTDCIFSWIIGSEEGGRQD